MGSSWDRGGIEVGRSGIGMGWFNCQQGLKTGLVLCINGPEG